MKIIIIKLDKIPGCGRKFKIKKLPDNDLYVRKDVMESASENCQYIYGCGEQSRSKSGSYYYWFPESVMFKDEMTRTLKKYYIPKKSPIYEKGFKKAIFEINEAQLFLLPNKQKQLN